MNTDAKILIKAANHLEKYGWIRNKLGEYDGPCCLLGAIGYSTSVGDTDSSAMYMLKLIINSGSIAEWNDKKCQSKEHAIRVLNDAASLALYETENT